MGMFVIQRFVQKIRWDVPGGPVEGPSNAGGTYAIRAGGTKIPNAPGRLGLCTAQTPSPAKG